MYRVSNDTVDSLDLYIIDSEFISSNPAFESLSGFESGISRIKPCVIAWAISLGLTSHAKRETQLCCCVTVIRVSGNSVTKRLWDWTSNYCATGPHISWHVNISFFVLQLLFKELRVWSMSVLWHQVDVIWMACHKTGQVLNPAACWGDMTPCRLVQTRVFINVAVSVCMYVFMYVHTHRTIRRNIFSW